MLNHRLAYRSSLQSIVNALVVLVLLALPACGDDDRAAPPDSMTAPVPIDPAGAFDIRSAFSLSAPPPTAASALGELTSATDGPDDPSRFLIDKLVARLPEGRAQLVAAAVAPYLAAYVQQRIDTFAPELAAGVKQLADGLNQVGRRFGTTETLTISEVGVVTASAADAQPVTVPGGAWVAQPVAQLGAVPGGARVAQHTITGLRWDAVEIAFAPLGRADIAMQTAVSLDGDRLAIAEHAAMIPYGIVLRLGLDRVVIPRVVPAATDLADALDRLVDCDRLGVHFADYIGFGSPDLYAGACSVALVRLAAEIYERLETAPVRLSIRGTAVAVDAHGDGPMDAITGGVWSGTVADVALAPSSFEGGTP